MLKHKLGLIERTAIALFLGVIGAILNIATQNSEPDSFITFITFIKAFSLLLIFSGMSLSVLNIATGLKQLNSEWS